MFDKLNKNLIMRVAIIAFGSYVASTNVGYSHNKHTSDCGCSESEKKDSNAKETKKGYTKTKSGLEYKDEKIGTGESPKKGKIVTVHYTGSLTNGKVFDSSVTRNQPFKFEIGIGQVIKGWDEGVMSMKVGGKRKLIIPAELGYGKSGAGDDIPGNSVLEFDVELLGVE